MFDSARGATRARRVLSHVLGLAVVLAAAPLVAADGPKQYSDWGDAAPVAEANTTFHDGCPIESPNGRQLYVASNRQPGGLGLNDIWVAERANTRSAWGPMQNIGAPVNSEFNDFCPTPLGGGWLMFVSERPGENTCGAGPGTGDMYIAHQRGKGTWTTPQHLGCHPTGPNFTGPEFSPSLVHTQGGTFLYFSSNGSDGGDQDIYVSRRDSNGTFGPATLVAELSIPGVVDQMPNVSRNGREIVFASNREGNMDIWTATWDRSEGRWSTPTKLPATVNTTAPESRPSLSGDGTRLYFGRGAPPGDIFVSTRVAVHEDD